MSHLAALILIVLVAYIGIRALVARYRYTGSKTHRDLQAARAWRRRVHQRHVSRSV